MPMTPPATATAILLAWISCCLPAAAATVPSVDFVSPHATYPTGISPSTVATGHLISATSVMDIAVGNQGTPYSVTVLLNSGSGTFTSPAALPLPGVPNSIAIIDLGNGKGDIVAACAAAPGTVRVFIGNGNGTFKTPVDYPINGSPVSMRVVDVTGEGHPDLLVGCSTSIQFLKGIGDGTFAAAVTVSTGNASCSSLAVGDLTGDGTMDIAATLSGAPYTLAGNGDGTFAAPVACTTPGLASLSIGIGDFNGDLLNDIAITDPSTNTVHILLNQGAGRFGPHLDYPVGRFPKSLNPVDLNGDLITDLVLVNVNDGTVGFLQGNGDGTFLPMTAYTTGNGPYIDAAGDFSGDGKLDLVTSNSAADSVSVLIQGLGAAPPAIANLSSSGTTATTVSLSWTTPLVETQGPASGYQLRYSTTSISAGNFSTATLVAAPPALGYVGGTVTFAVAGLTPGTAYSFAIATSDAFGRTSAISNVVGATTLASDTLAPSAVANLAATGVVAGVRLTWTAPGNDGALGTAASYQLRVSTSAITAPADFAAAIPVAGVPAPQTAGAAESFPVGGLIPGATYWFALEATDAASNVSALSNVVSAVVLDAANAPLAISDLVATAYGVRTVLLSWTAPADGAPSGTVTAYQLRMSTAPITPLNFAAATLVALPAPGSPLASQAAAVGGLAAGTTYYFALASSDAASLTSEISDVATATTASTDIIPPAAIITLAASAAVDGATLSWTAPGDDGAYGSAASYQLRYSTSAITGPADFAAATPVAGVPGPQAAGAAESFTVGGLTPGVTYWFALVAVDAAANSGALSNVVSAMPTAPGGGGGGSSSGGGGSTSHGCGLGGGAATLALLALMSALQPRQRRRQG